MAKQDKQIPAVLAFDKKIVVSDAVMSATNWVYQNLQNEHLKCEPTKSWEEAMGVAATIPLKLQEKSVRGTISNRLKSAIAKDPTKLNAEVEKANLQTVDACALPLDKDTLKLEFTVKFLGNIDQACTCDKPEFQQNLTERVNDYINQHKCTELAYRYATNLVNGRFLWRNRVGAEHIMVVIEVLTEDESALTIRFDAKEDVSLQDFECKQYEIGLLAERIEKTLASKQDFLLLKVTCYAKLGAGQEVYPSEELVLDKKTKQNGDKSKILYKVNEQAAMHSQKIGNAIRTIDTWYPEYTNMPIAIEPYGAVTTLGRAFRNPQAKNDFYSLFDNWVLGSRELTTEESHYVVAMLIRGGVFGESSKEA
jgi:CRISPR-associated protein Csy3